MKKSLGRRKPATHSSAEGALAQSNRELQARNAELDAFAPTVAHDLKGSLTMCVGYADVLQDSDVQFWVRDNGTGLTAEQQQQLFVPFTCLKQIRVEGHGLGLSIVKRLVEKLGGQGGVVSAPGEATVFSFTLPQGL